MAKKRSFHNAKHFSSRHDFDGRAAEKGKVLVPFHKDILGLRQEGCIQDKFITMYIAGLKFEIGLMPIDEAQFPSYMREFLGGIEAELDEMREAPCVPGYKNADEPIFRSGYCRYKNRPDKGELLYRLAALFSLPLYLLLFDLLNSL